MNREEFDSGVWQEFYSPLTSFDMARELSELDEEADWTERDERIWQEYCEMENERESKVDRWHKVVFESNRLYDKPAGPPSPFGESGIGQSGTDVSTW